MEKHGEKWKGLESLQNIGVLTPKMKVVGSHGIYQNTNMRIYIYKHIWYIQ